MGQGIIYLITNLVNGKKYVGQTITTTASRWSTHKGAARRGTNNYKITRAIRKYGDHAFSIETLVTIPLEALDAVESAFISAMHLQDMKYGYNTTSGGSGCAITRSNNIKAAMLDIPRVVSPTWFKKGCVSLNKGVPQTEEAKRHHSLMMKGKKQSPETVAKRTAAVKGKKRTAEQRQRMKDASGRVGKKNSDSHNKANSEARLANWADPVFRDKMMAVRRYKAEIRNAAKIAA